MTRMTRTVLIAVVALLAACGGDPPDPVVEAPPSLASPTPSTASGIDVPTEAVAYTAGTASVTTEGASAATFEAPLDTDPESFPNALDPEDGEVNLDWATEDNTQGMLLTLTPSDTYDSGFDAFVAIKTGTGDLEYFPDAFHSKCQVTVDAHNTSGLSGSFICTDLPSSDGSVTIGATGTFSATT